MPDNDRTFSPIINSIVTAILGQLYKTVASLGGSLASPTYLILEEMANIGNTCCQLINLKEVFRLVNISLGLHMIILKGLNIKYLLLFFTKFFFCNNSFFFKLK